MRQTPDTPPLAATVVLVRDGDDGLEVLLLERPHDRGSFAGAWVFPGGSVDPEDARDDDASADARLRRAAVRETAEETGLVVAQAALVELATWHPPTQAQKRLRTTFFLAVAPAGEIAIAADEAVAFAWLRPTDALAGHAAGDLLLFPPTWVTLHGLETAVSAAAAIAAAATARPGEFHTRIVGEWQVALWQEDGAFETDDLTAPGARHRLTMTERPWVYERSDAPHETPADGAERHG